MNRGVGVRLTAGLLTAIFAVGTAGSVGASGALAAPSSPVPRIVGGSPTTITDVPWQVLIIVGGKLCGGSIISSTWILTAAHCVNGLGPSQVSVYSGISNNSQRQ